MACRCLVGLEKGKRAFCACFRVSAAGGFVYIYTRTRTRKGFGLGRAFPFADKFRKQNKVGSDTRKQNTGFPSLFRKLNKGLSVGRFVFWLKNSQRLFSVGRVLLSEKRQTVAGSVYVYTYTRARVGSVLSLSVFSYPKKLFFLFHSFFIYFFLLFLFSVKA